MAFRFDLSFYFNRNDLLADIGDETNLAGFSVVGVVINVQILHGFKLLTNVLLCERAPLNSTKSALPSSRCADEIQAYN